MKKTLPFLVLLISIFFVSCSNDESETNGDDQLLVAKTPFEFADLIEAIVDTVYVGFNHIEDLDGSDVPKADLIAGISTLETEIRTAKTEIGAIQPIGKKPELCLNAGNNCLDAAEQLLSFFKRNADLLSKPDNTWTDAEFETFDKLFSKFNETLENAIDDLYDASDRYLDSQVSK